MASRPDSDGAAFVAALLAAAGRRDPVAEVRAVLKLWRSERLTIPAELEPRETVADVARRMLAAGVGRDAAAALVARRCGCTVRHARRALAAVADMFADECPRSG
jgi:hypothetical protein